MNYGKEVFKNVTTESKLLGRDQILNSCNHYVFKASDMSILNRFLIMGTEGGTYYIDQKKLTMDNAETILRMIKSSDETARMVVDKVVEVSNGGRAQKNDPAIFVLALVASFGGDSARKYAFSNLIQVCRIGTHLFYFLETMKSMRGWGRGLRTAVSNWYTDRSIDSLTTQLLKYKNRHGWTHKDAIAKAHVKPQHDEQAYMFKHLFHTELSCDTELFESSRYFVGANFNHIVGTDVRKAVKYIKDLNLPREVVPTEMLNDPLIWDALVDNNMGYTALIRNLGKMSAIKYLTTNSESTRKVINLLTNKDKITASRVHPISILQALMVYKRGEGIRGSLSWNTVKTIVDALEDAFYTSFKNVEPTGKRHMISIDMSGSMTWHISENEVLTSSAVAGAMAMSVVRTESMYDIMGFDSKFKPLNITKRSSIADVYNEIYHGTFGRTDCSVPMQYALDNKIPVDVFTIWTDNETNCSRVHPSVALKNYREVMGIDAKLIVCATCANSFTIADPEDRGMLDIAGFDSSVPTIIHDFSLGLI